MKDENKNILTSRWLRSFLILAIIYFSQIYPYYHIHHTHDQGNLEFEISSHPIELDQEHDSDHHHHDEDNSHTNNHQHYFDSHIKWHILRTQNQRTLLSDEQLILSSTPHIIVSDIYSSDIFLKTYPCLENNYSHPLLIRGPPSCV